MSERIDEHFNHLLSLMELEAEAEKQQALVEIQRRPANEAEASGYSLVNLTIREEEAGLGGRILLTLGKRDQNQELPWTRLGIGAPVLLTEENQAGETGWRGIISRISRQTVQVAFEQWPELEDERGTFRLDRSSDEVARQRLRQALEKVRTARTGRLADLRDVLLGLASPRFQKPAPYQPLSSKLNTSQQEAVQFALSAEDYAIIHGPPGTGKTTTVVEFIRQAVQRGETVLTVAPSNLAVDNVFERLLAARENAVRLGHPARVLPGLREHTLDLMVENHPEVKVARRLTREAHQLFNQASRYTRARPEPGARQAQRAEARQMLAEARQIEDQIFKHLLDSAQVVCATNTGLDRRLLGNRMFDWIVMDEASQGTEPAAWIPLQWARKLVLAGDPCQLPPTVISPQAAREGYSTSLMERLMADNPGEIDRLLEIQYRMHQDIMAYSSQEFYGGRLEADSSVRQHLLSDLPGVKGNDLTRTPVTFIDTAGAGYDEQVEPDGESRWNPSEADLVQRKVEELIAAGLVLSAIAVIAPYAAQVRYLREQIRSNEIEVDSVDGFQGREKEAVVVSLVRSNIEGEIGFLADVRRMNVALTRARRKLIVIGDSATVTRHPFYQRLVDYFDRTGAYHSVWEEPGF